MATSNEEYEKFKEKYNVESDNKFELEPMGVKSLFILFIVFLFVVSDIYTNFVISQFKGATDERNVTDYGIILQGISVVILFTMLEYMRSYNIL